MRAWRLVPEDGSGFTGWVDGAGQVVEATQPGVTTEELDKLAYTFAMDHGALPATLTVPGSVASWTMAHAAHGRLPLRRNLVDLVECSAVQYECPVDFASGCGRVGRCSGTNHPRTRRFRMISRRRHAKHHSP